MHSRSGLEPLHGRFGRAWTHRAQMFLHDAVATLETQSAKFFMQPDSGQIRVAFQQLRDLIRISVQQTRPARALAFRFASPMVLMLLQHAIHTLAVHSQQARDGSSRSA